MNKNTFWKKYTRPFICLIIVLVFFTMFTIRLVDWQLIQGDYYREEVSTRANYVLTSDATRGEIVDVNGEVIAANTTNYTVVLDKLYINSDMHINDVIVEMFDLLETFAKGQSVTVVEDAFLNETYSREGNEAHDSLVDSGKEGAVNGAGDNGCVE